LQKTMQLSSSSAMVWHMAYLASVYTMVKVNVEWHSSVRYTAPYITCAPVGLMRGGLMSATANACVLGYVVPPDIRDSEGGLPSSV